MDLVLGEGDLMIGFSNIPSLVSQFSQDVFYGLLWPLGVEENVANRIFTYPN